MIDSCPGIKHNSCANLDGKLVIACQLVYLGPRVGACVPKPPSVLQFPSQLRRLCNELGNVGGSEWPPTMLWIASAAG